MSRPDGWSADDPEARALLEENATLTATCDMYRQRATAAEAEVERLRGLVRWFLDGDDHTHEDDCGARGSHDLDVCRNTKPCADETCEGPHCTCEATMMRDRARAALGEEQFAAANTAAIVALHNAWPAISARIRAADVDAANLRVMLDRALGENVGLRAECERLRAALRSVLAEHDGMHDDDCDVRGMSTGDDGVSHNAWGEERRCTCGSTGSRNVARAALGEP